VKLLVLSGLPASGKTTLAASLKASYGNRVEVISTSSCLKTAAPEATTRQDLIRAGESLDLTTNYSWICKFINVAQDRDLIVLDRVRKVGQLKILKELYSIIHVHVRASQHEVANRYARRKEAMNWNDAAVADEDNDALESLADFVIDTTVLSKEQSVKMVIACLRR
jgi:adenylate kinase family enzyme